MNIDYVLSAHGLFKRGSGKLTYESVTNLTSKPIENGTKIKVDWTNPSIAEYVKTELFVSTIDLSNLDYDQTSAVSAKVIDGTLQTYQHPATIGQTYYFKAFVTYFTFGQNVVSKGVTTFITATDKTPPAPITSFVANGDDQSAKLSWVNPIDTDFNKVKIVYKTGGYPSSHTDGTVGYEGSATSVTITGLTNDIEYFIRGFTFDNQMNINNDISQQISVKPESVKIYGVKIDKNNSNPLTAVTYIDNAIGMIGGSNEWDSVYPYNQIRPVLFKDGVVVGELQKNDFSKFLDGTTADITSGNDGDVMIEFPKIWWKFETIGTDLYVKYATKQIDSTWKCLAHAKGITEKEKMYIGAYLGNELASKLRSLSGKTPTLNKTIGAFRTSAQANGAGYQQVGYFQLLMLQILYLIKYKSLDSQTALGRGFVDGNAAITNTGGTNSKGMYFGEATGKQQMKFAGIEDFWGNCYYWIEGFFNNASRNILIGNQNFNDTGNGYTNYGQGSTANLNGFINEVQGSTETGFIPKSVIGSATTYYCDEARLNPTCFPIFGGYWVSSDSAGAYQLFAIYTATETFSRVAARLCYV
ncbi:fibronectin type III domain-containing protein [Bacillus sp. JJ1474]|uniref:fibronectin type III domain-containing protein n=1 Tax=Bacillus sp. JJ1474 TaxID=3122955 RepID=UPI002FFF092A